MLIEIVGCSTRNKGAELLLLAVREHFAARRDVQLTVTPWFGPWSDRAKYGLLTRIDVKSFGRAYLALNLVPKSARRSYGLASHSDVDLVLDASGFAYGDQHGPQPARNLAAYYEKMRRSGKRIVLLPQAFGPFTDPEVARQMRWLLESVDLAYARDSASRQYLEELSPGNPKLRQAPDITIALDGACDMHELQTTEGTVGIVPNSRMLDKNGPRVAAAYVPAMIAIARHIQERGMRPVLLVHDDSEDLELAERILAEGKLDLRLIHERDPLKIKSVIRSLSGLVGSRFHALVSALSQSVPSVAMGWSHKYRTLLEAYGCPENLIDLREDGLDLSALDRLCAAPVRFAQREVLGKANRELRRELDGMWAEIDQAAHA